MVFGEMTTGVKQTVIRNPTWWKRRTSMERALILGAIMAGLVAVSLAVALAIVLCKGRITSESDAHFNALPYNGNAIIEVHSRGKENSANVCLTPGCIHTASKVLETIDESVDPCDDFYDFACGNFVKKTNIPDDKSSVTTFSVINDLLQEQLRTMIEEPIRKNEPKPFVLTKKLYRACMNKTLIEEDGLKTIKGILGVFGGWPVLDGDQWKEDEFDWIQTVYKFRKTGYSVDYLIDFSVAIDLKNSTKRVIDLDQASLGLRREFLIKGIEDKLVKAYYDYMVDVAVIFGANKTRAEQELKESLEFEMKLANISLPSEKRRNASALYNPMTISELQSKYPIVNWKEFVNVLLAPDTHVEDDETVIVSIPKYLIDFEELMKVTSKRTQSNYLLWRAVASSVTYLNEELRNRQLLYSTIVTGKTERASRWKECIDIAAGSLGNAAGALYVRKYFNEESRQNAIQMVKDIRAEFIEIVKKVDWMDEKSRKRALEKAEAMSSHIAYPDELLDDAVLEKFYKDLELDSEKYLMSVINLTQFATRFSFRRLRQPVNKTDWITHGRPAIVNAFYSAIENSIQFPAGILQGVFFSNDRPKYMNYGAIGFVIGHEITHGFDDQGRQFDKDGNLVDWWEPETQKAFVKKAQCIIDQYSNFTVPEIGLNLKGVNTQGENIADNGGIKEAYYAYEAWNARTNVTEPQLPGLNYTPRQMFWLSAAATWCSKYRSEALKIRVLTSLHSPGRFRVIGPLRNLKEFARDFNCPLGSPMNPEQKCTVW